MSVYHYLPAPATGAILSKAYLSQLADNDRYFIGIAEARDPVPYMLQYRWEDDSTVSRRIWSGWMWYDTNRETTVNYRFRCTSDSAGHDSNVKLYFNGVLKATAENNTQSGSFAGPSSDGLYQVYFDIDRGNSDSDYNSTAEICPPWTTYNGAYTFSPVFGTFVDGGYGSVGHFEGLAHNDLYFKDIVSPQTAGQQIKKYGYHWDERDSLETLVIWRAEIPYRSTHRMIYYKLGFQAGSANNGDDEWIEIRWNSAGGTPQTIYSNRLGYEVGTDSTAITDNAMHTIEGYTSMGTGYTSGTYYQMDVRIRRTGTDGSGAMAHVYYITQGTSGAISYTDPRDYTVGQYVYGNTGGQRTALSNLTSTDNTINSWLTYKKYACRAAVNPYPARRGGTQWYMHLTRRSDFLYYRGRGAKLHFANNTKEVTLQDAGTDEDTTVYRILDLNTVTGLHYGMLYEITGNIEFAMEI